MSHCLRFLCFFQCLLIRVQHKFATVIDKVLSNDAKRQIDSEAIFLRCKHDRVTDECAPSWTLDGRQAIVQLMGELMG